MGSSGGRLEPRPAGRSSGEPEGVSCEWCVRQRTPGGNAIVWVTAPGARAAVAIANRRLARMGGWRVGPDVVLEVFPREEYPERAEPRDYTRSVIG